MRTPMTLGVLVVLLLVVAGCNPFLDRRGATSPPSLVRVDTSSADKLAWRTV
jgi:hypothetical protein